MLGPVLNTRRRAARGAVGLVALGALVMLALALPLGARSATTAPAPSTPAALCAAKHAGEKCLAGGGRSLPSCATCVSHKGWPRITGVIWQVTENARTTHTFAGGPDNDELLGRHGTNAIAGLGGDDVIWGDSAATGNGPPQIDVLVGGDGNDWIYSSHGTNYIFGGPGRDAIFAFFGKGVVDCGPGQDTLRLHRGKHLYKVHNCEKIIRSGH